MTAGIRSMIATAGLAVLTNSVPQGRDVVFDVGALASYTVLFDADAVSDDVAVADGVASVGPHETPTDTTGGGFDLTDALLQGQGVPDHDGGPDLHGTAELQLEPPTPLTLPQPPDTVRQLRLILSCSERSAR